MSDELGTTPPATTADDIDLDPVTFEVLRNSFSYLVDRMGAQLQRTCYSFIVYIGDFSHALNDADGNTVMQGSEDIASQVGTLHLTCQSVIDHFEGDIHRGDVFLINDPYEGSTHLPDVRVVRPVFTDGDDPIAYTQSNGHWPDVGGPTPGSFNIEAAEFHGEGLRIPPVKIREKGVYRDDVINLITANMRISENRIGDIKAQVKATKVAEKRLLELVEKYGEGTVLTAFDETQNYVERIARERIAELPDGTWHTWDFLDSDPGKDEGLVRVDVEMTIDSDEVYYDLSGSDPYIKGFLNGTFATTFTGVVSGLKMAVFPDLPLNSGLYNVVNVTAPEGSVVNAPEPAAVTGGVSGVFEKIMSSSFKIWADILPERAMSPAFNLEYLLIGGKDTRSGSPEEFMWHDWLAGGWGGKNGEDGSSATAPMFGASLGVPFFEGQERNNPMRTTAHAIVTDSGGPGKWRGGCGVYKGAELTDAADTVMSYSCDRGRAVVWGLNGGLPGLPHGVRLNPGTDDEEYLGTVFSNVELEPGDTFGRPSSGGGGFGDPLERDPERVLSDVVQEYVSVERAAKDYGVVVDALDADLGTYEIDHDATAEKRDFVRTNRRRWMDTDPAAVATMYRDDEATVLDCIRQYGVVLDWKRGDVLETSTAQYRELLQDRTIPHW